MKLTRNAGLATFCAGLALASGCRQWGIGRTDRGVYRLIADRQQRTLGTTSDVGIGSEAAEPAGDDRIYSLTPRPLTSDVPGAFDVGTSATGSAVVDGSAEESDSESSPLETELGLSIFAADDLPDVQLFSLRDALSFAMGSARTLQDAKEELYLAALDLTLERHLWTPQFVASIEARMNYADAGGLHDAERAVSAISDVTLSQRLPYGGEVSARVISTLVRDLEEYVTSGESGSMILDARIPLLRGAGRVAYESRYAAERELIYAVRAYERFRRSFVVQVAALYFSLQESKAACANTYKAYQSRKGDWEKADFVNRMGRSKTIFEAPRAKSSLRQAQAALVSAKERYATALDRFKISIGMSVDKLLDVVDQGDDLDSKTLDLLLPNVDVKAAEETALKYRLDLLNIADRLDDTRRGVRIAANRILPDLEATAGATFDTDPEHLNAISYNPERATWQGGLVLRTDDRKAERNAYRAALVATRQAQRSYGELSDTVVADVRRALRRIAQQDDLLRIQALSVEENELRLEAARAQFDLGRSTNQDVVDAENDLLQARNDYASAVAAYRNAILQFRLDTGTLRVSDDGRWLIETGPGN